MIKFISLASGSSGNCYYLGLNGKGILIDAGIHVRQIKSALSNVGISFESIMAVFVTHDHADHIKSLSSLGEKYNLPIYATRDTHAGINRNYCINPKLSTSVRYVEKLKTTELFGFSLTPFEVPHDGSDNVGYFVEADGKTFCFVTDIGHITPVVKDFGSKANYLIIEANYDRNMLDMGRYPAFLKARITSPVGHLCNSDTAQFLIDIVNPDLKHIWLCHLSADNNHPEIAYKTVQMALAQYGIIVDKDIKLTALKRTTPSELYEFA